MAKNQSINPRGDKRKLRDYYPVILELSERIHCQAEGIPSDDLEPGFRLSSESHRECHQAISQLRAAIALLQKIGTRENERYSAHYDALHPARPSTTKPALGTPTTRGSVPKLRLVIDNTKCVHGPDQSAS